jgi:FkbM family methyltransferase
MEFGARFGTTTCEIAKKLRNSGRLVAVEPDQNVWPDLQANVESHSCNAHILRGVLSATPVRFEYSNYASRTAEVGASSGADVVTVPNYLFDEVEQALGAKVDTLLIDCEGCAQHMMDQIGPKIQSQVNLVLF